MWAAGSEPAEQDIRMKNTITAQIRALQTMAPQQLASSYEALFGRPPRVRNAAWLRRQVAWQLQARELGGLSDRAGRKHSYIRPTDDEARQAIEAEILWQLGERPEFVP